MQRAAKPSQVGFCCCSAKASCPALTLSLFALWRAFSAFRLLELLPFDRRNRLLARAFFPADNDLRRKFTTVQVLPGRGWWRLARRWGKVSAAQLLLLIYCCRCNLTPLVSSKVDSSSQVLAEPQLLLRGFVADGTHTHAAERAEFLLPPHCRAAGRTTSPSQGRRQRTTRAP